MIEPVEERVVANGLAHHVVTWDGRRAARAGGATFVLCHGFLDLAWSWDRVARHLAGAGHRVVAFDWRGHGTSEWIGPGAYYHFPDYVRDLDALLPQIADEPPHLVGHSMGGTACSLFAATRPGAIRTLTLIEGIGPPEHPPELTPDRFGAWLRTIAEARARGPRRMAGLEDALARMRVQNPTLDDAFGLFLARKATRTTEDGALVWTFDPLHRTTSPVPFQLAAYLAFLERIECSVLLVGGESGFRVPGEKERASKIRDHAWVELDSVGHMIHWQAPERLAEALLGFTETR